VAHSVVEKIVEGSLEVEASQEEVDLQIRPIM